MSENKPEPSIKLEYNRVAWDQRWKMKPSSMLPAITGIAKEDTQKHPWKYPFYAAYLGAICLLGWSGTWALILGAGIGYIRLDEKRGWTEWGKWAGGRLTEISNKTMQDMMDKNPECFVFVPPPKEGQSKIMRILTWTPAENHFHITGFGLKLQKEPWKQAWTDTKEISWHAGGVLSDGTKKSWQKFRQYLPF